MRISVRSPMRVDCRAATRARGRRRLRPHRRAAPRLRPRQRRSGRSQPGSDRVLKTYAADTWRSFEAMAVPRTGLPADNIGGDLSPSSRSALHLARPTSAPTCGAPSPPATPA